MFKGILQLAILGLEQQFYINLNLYIEWYNRYIYIFIMYNRYELKRSWRKRNVSSVLQLDFLSSSL